MEGTKFRLITTILYNNVMIVGLLSFITCIIYNVNIYFIYLRFQWLVIRSGPSDAFAHFSTPGQSTTEPSPKIFSIYAFGK